MKRRLQFAKPSLAIALLPLLMAQPVAAFAQQHERPEARREQHAAKPAEKRQEQHPYAGDWLKRYENVPSQQQEQTLRSEKDFQKLPPERQQQLVNRLHEFNSKPAEEKQRMIRRMEAFSQLPAQERQAIRQANEQRKLLPPERKQAVNRAYNFLKELPPEQQERALNSPRFQQNFSASERHIMRDMLKAPQVEPRLGDLNQPQ